MVERAGLGYGCNPGNNAYLVFIRQAHICYHTICQENDLNNGQNHDRSRKMINYLGRILVVVVLLLLLGIRWRISPGLAMWRGVATH